MADTAVLERSNRDKCQCVLDLTRVTRTTADLGARSALRDRLSGLRDCLEENRRIIRQHLEAVRKLSYILTEQMRSSELDGTYLPSVASVVRKK